MTHLGGFGPEQEIPQDGDPLLVRPFLLREPGTSDTAPSGQRWPAEKYRTIRSHRAGGPNASSGPPAAQPEPMRRSHTGTAAGIAAGHRDRPSPGPAAPGDTTGPRRRRSFVLAGAGTAAVLGMAALGYGLGRPAGEDDGERPAGALPPPPAASAAETGAPPAVPALPDGGTTRPARPDDRTAGATRPGTPGGTGGAPGASPGTAAPAAGTPAGTATSPAVSGAVAPEPEATLSAAPDVARVGTIAGDGNLCLDVNGGVPADHNHVQVFDCNGTNAQRWTLAPDGTLQAVGKCAQVTGDATVHIIGCDSRDEAQWRAGADESLVNIATNQCLTDPESGNRSGAGVRVTACTGGDNQQWSLP